METEHPDMSKIAEDHRVTANLTITRNAETVSINAILSGDRKDDALRLARMALAAQYAAMSKGLLSFGDLLDQHLAFDKKRADFALNELHEAMSRLPVAIPAMEGGL